MITLKQNIEFLQNYKNWRRGAYDSIEQPAPLLIGLHIDYAIEKLKQLEKEEWGEDRINIIGQNGGDGEHYGQV